MAPAGEKALGTNSCAPALREKLLPGTNSRAVGRSLGRTGLLGVSLPSLGVWGGSVVPFCCAAFSAGRGPAGRSSCDPSMLMARVDAAPLRSVSIYCSCCKRPAWQVF